MSPSTYVLRLCRWFKGHPIAVAAVGGCLLVEMAFSAFVPMAFSHLIDKAIIPKDGSVLMKVLVVLCLASVVTTFAGVLGDYIYARVFTRIVADIRQRLFDHLQSLSPSFYQKHSAGEIAARYSNDLVSVEQTLTSWIPWGWKPLLELIGYNAVMFSIDWRLGLLAQLIWPLTLIGPRFFAPKASLTAEQRKEREASVLTAVDEATAGRHLVRAFGLEQTMSQRFATHVRALMETARRGVFFGSALERSASVGIYSLQIIVIGAGASLAFKGLISVGNLVAFYSVFVSLSNALYYLAQYSSSLINSAAGLARIEEFLDERSSVPQAPNAIELPEINRGITVQGCAYAPDGHRRILDGITLDIRHGEFVSLVGPSGSGKSTLLNLITRSFDPDEGKVLIDTCNIREVTRSSFVKQSAMVFQESFLYNCSVRENLRLGRQEATDAEIEQACRDAEIHDIILAMPKGYDSPVGERGSLLSGGQRQRLAIARALVRNPRILFLDEATSALDPGTEIAINQTIERISKGRTVIAVTHRLASVVNCDRVFVLNQGKLAESGSHAELLKHEGLYASLWRKQEGIHASVDGRHVDITTARLRRIPILSKIDDSLLEKLANTLFVTEHFAPGSVIVRQGDQGDKFYIIARGRVEVLRRDDNGVDCQISVLEDGDNFGELALLRDVPRNATVRALDPCLVLSLQRQHFQGLLDQSPEARAAVLLQAAERGAHSSTGVPFQPLSVSNK